MKFEIKLVAPAEIVVAVPVLLASQSEVVGDGENPSDQPTLDFVCKHLGPNEIAAWIESFGETRSAASAMAEVVKGFRTTVRDEFGNALSANARSLAKLLDQVEAQPDADGSKRSLFWAFVAEYQRALAKGAEKNSGASRC
jgi:hypothetical protein